MIMEMPHISCAGLSCAFPPWPLFNPQPCPDAPPWEGGGQARQGLHPARPHAPTYPHLPQQTPSPGSNTCSDINKTALPNPQSHPQATRSRGHGQNQGPPSTSTPPSASSLLLIDGCASSEDPFSRGLGLSQGPTDMRVQRNAKQPLGWRAGQPDSSLIQVILSKSHDLSDPTPPCVMKVWVRSF